MFYDYIIPFLASEEALVEWNKYTILPIFIFYLWLEYDFYKFKSRNVRILYVFELLISEIKVKKATVFD